MIKRLVICSAGLSLLGVAHSPPASWNDSYPAWSPDGQWIAFTSDRDGNDDIYVMRADHSSPRRITHHPGADSWASWTPDGQRIVFDSDRDGNRELYSVGLSGGAPERLTIAPAYYDAVASVSPADGTIAFDSDRGSDRLADVWLLRPGQTEPVALTEGPMSNGHPAWSPDGRQVAFRAGAVTPNAPRLSELYVQEVSAGPARQLTKRGGSVSHPSWSPDGSRIVFAARRDSFPDIFELDLRSGTERRLTHSVAPEHRPSYSPDGRTLVFAVREQGRWQLRTVAATAVGSSRTPEALITRAASAMGGMGLLSTLPTLRTRYHLIEHGLGQEEWPGGPAPSSLHLGERGYAPSLARERLDMRRHMSGGRLYVRSLDAGAWHRLDAGGTTTAAPVEATLSAALAAIHPEALLPRLLAMDTNVMRVDAGRSFAGRPAAALRVRLGELPLTVFFDDASGRMLGVEWNDAQLGGREGESLRVTFTQYRPAVGVPGTPSLPHLVEVHRGARLWQVRSYDEFDVGGPLPERVTPVAAPLAVQEITVAPNAVLLRAGDNNPLLVDAGERLVLVDVPETVERARAVAQVVRARANGRPVSVVLTHLHDDHIAGLAGLVDLTGLEVVGHERVEEALRGLVTRHLASANASIRLVGPRLRLGAGEAAVDIIALPHSHSDAQLVAYLPVSRTLFEVDLLRGVLPHSTAELVEWVRTSGLDVRTVASSHGTQPLSWERFQLSARAWQDSVAAPRRP